MPIVKGGKVLFVSASNKHAWIFPKGGIEESALRECCEEAGMIGVLGSNLSEVTCETQKARKRRLLLAMARRMMTLWQALHACQVSPSSCCSHPFNRNNDDEVDDDKIDDDEVDDDKVLVHGPKKCTHEPIAPMRRCVRRTSVLVIHFSIDFSRSQFHTNCS